MTLPTSPRLERAAGRRGLVAVFGDEKGAPAARLDEDLVGEFWRGWGRASFEVVVLTASARRFGSLWRCARNEVPAHRWAWYSFATFEVLALDPREALEGNVWLNLLAERAPLLYETAAASG